MTPGAGRVRAVLCDVDGTLYRQGPLRRRMAAELLGNLLARPGGGWRVIRILRRFRAERESLRGACGEASALDALQYEVPARKLGVPAAEVREVVGEWMQRRPLAHLGSCRRPGVEEFLEACRAGGVRVGAFSDYPTRDKVHGLGLGGRFDLHLCATDPEVDAFKPSPKGILVACRSWGLEPGHLLYIGDRPEVDGAAAAAAGAGFALVGGGRGGRGAGTLDFRELIDRLG